MYFCGNTRQGEFGISMAVAVSFWLILWWRFFSGLKGLHFNMNETQIGKDKIIGVEVYFQCPCLVKLI